MVAETQSFQPEFTDLVSLLRVSVQRFGDRPLFGVRESSGWRWTTYGEFSRLVDRFRAGLASLGIGRGDRVAVISNNRLEWAVAAHAVYSLGGCYVPMYEAQLDKEWEFILADSGSLVCLVASAAIEERVHKLAGRLPALKHIVSFDRQSSGPTYETLLARGEGHAVPPAEPDRTEIACLIYTSGTTGNPKGVRLSHWNLATNVSALLTLIELKGQDRGIAFLPWSHVFGGVVELHSMIGVGGSMAICGDPTKLGLYLPEVRPTVLFAVPRVWNRLYESVKKTMATKPAPIRLAFETAMQAKNKLRRKESLSFGESLALKLAENVVFPKIREAFGGELKFACSGAAALSRDVAEFIENIGIEVYEGYGMTEGSGCTTAQPLGKARLGSVGKPIPGVHVVIDRALGTAPGEGEIVLYGNGVMAGYHNRDDLTRESMTDDGGLRTGDLGRLDDDGYLYITGRVKELYKLENGKYVAPVPLEDQLTLSPYIAQCMVTGSGRPHNVALIVPDMNALRGWAREHGIETDGESLLVDPRVRQLLEGEVEQYSKEFKGYERIKDFVIDTEELSIQNGMLTPKLTLKRARIMTKYEQVFASLYPPVPSERPEPRSSYIRELRPSAPAATARSA